MPKSRVKRHAVIQPSETSYRLIPLTKNKNAIVDSGLFKFLSQWNWYATANPRSKTFYAVRDDGEQIIWMHRLILGCSNEQEVDHKNRNGLDNRKKNLRPCSRSTNSCNTGMRSHNTSGFRGVTRHGVAWQAQATENGRCFYLGRFKKKEEAAQAYDAFVKKRRGEFATTNF